MSNPVDSRGKVALVTGPTAVSASRSRSSSHGADRAVIASRDEVKGEQAAEHIPAGGGKATFLSLDVNNSQSIGPPSVALRRLLTGWTF